MIRIKNSFGIARLPNEYQEVEYLELTGTQYINTGYTAPANSNVEVEIKTSTQIDGNERRFLFGTRGGASFILWFGDYQNKLYYDFHYGTGSGSGSWINDYVNGTVVDIKMNSTGLYINGNTMDSSGAGTSFAGCTYPMYLGAIYTGSIMGYYGGRIYSCTIKNGSTPIRDFIPCYRKSDNIAGLYDAVNGVFYENAGTGTFLIGAEVNTRDVNIKPIVGDKPLIRRYAGDKLVYGKEPSDYEQLINYTMLYDNGNECTNITGGWNLHTNNYGTLTKNTNNIYFNSTGNGICIKTKNQINVSGYNGWLVISKNYTYGESAGQNAIWCTTSTNTYGYPDNDVMVVPATNSSYNNMTDEGNRKPVFWYSFYKTSTGSGYIKKCWRNNHHTGNLAAIAMTKPDNWQELANILNINATSINDIITASDKLLNNKDSVLYMLYNCTGDFMAAAVQSETFLTALNNSPYKTKIYANEHWNKFLAMVA